MKKQSMGTASIGVGAFLIFLGVFYIVLTYLKITPEQKVIPLLTNYVIGGIGILIGLLLLGYGIYTRRVLLYMLGRSRGSSGSRPSKPRS